MGREINVPCSLWNSNAEEISHPPSITQSKTKYDSLPHLPQKPKKSIYANVSKTIKSTTPPRILKFEMWN